MKGLEGEERTNERTEMEEDTHSCGLPLSDVLLKRKVHLMFTLANWCR